MTDQETTRGYRCPEYGCGIEMNTGDELAAHLEWDHNWSRPKADERVRHL